ncbi:TrmH family RNA methyltransferase [Lignipirellula cremea]|uniref:23S rRNA (Uridine(2479)-2'-O)-methyltransferase n=1 Tax=Lignipirellula cremea TaxID=2528010 RepID=A0A518DWH7_9BACT|nr:RNA methyltransferase [Lignipirellula cremea]QDU96184.1 23S rRNA (uridine(2479)-2'-O)-methyltransferase [Lignipirellula cremea]
MFIQSLQNPRVKAAQRLRQRRGREQQQRILIDGVRENRLALTSGVEFVELYYCPQHLQAEADALLSQAAAAGVALLETSPAVFERLAFGDRIEGVVGVAATPDRSLQQATLGDCPLLAIIEGVEKPGNLGAMIRTADAAGVDAVVLVDCRTDLFNPNLIRASLGALFVMPVFTAEVNEARQWLASHEIPVYAALVDGSIPYYTADFRGPTALVLGSEAEGLTAAWRRDCTPVRLPMHGRVDSLNVSATAAVLLYEAVRQRAIG